MSARDRRTGRAQRLGLLGRGAAFGEVSLVMDIRRTTTVTAGRVCVRGCVCVCVCARARAFLRVCVWLGDWVAGWVGLVWVAG